VLRYSEDAPSRLIGDPWRIRQIITNLVGNTIKFTAEGHVLVTVDEESGSDENVALNISVTDTGIEEDALQTLFGEFTQADVSPTRRWPTWT
jgi:signal transduction histidine kinase